MQILNSFELSDQSSGIGSLTLKIIFVRQSLTHKEFSKQLKSFGQTL
jgi:hypothetical protein